MCLSLAVVAALLFGILLLHPHYWHLNHLSILVPAMSHLSIPGHGTIPLSILVQTENRLSIPEEGVDVLWTAVAEHSIHPLLPVLIGL
jgi:hypothetical protein